MISRRAFLGTTACFPLVRTVRADEEVAANPEVIPPEGVPAVIKAIPAFGFSGVALFQGRLYASSNVGLLEFRDGDLEALYRWRTEDSVVVGPWNDSAHDALWVQHVGTLVLTYRDRAGWHNVELPVPERGWYTRHEILIGFRGISSRDHFWLIGGGHVWRWGPERSAWVPEPLPTNPEFRGTIAVAPLHEGLLHVANEDLYHRKFAAYTFIDEWKRLPLGGFAFGHIATVGDAAYVSTEAGELLRVTPTEMQKFETPGRCEAITTTSKGKLLASFCDQGVFVFDGAWVKLFAYPYPPGEGEHWTYLAESEGQVAYATASRLHRVDVDTGKLTYSGTDALWISDGDTLKLHFLRSCLV